MSVACRVPAARPPPPGLRPRPLRCTGRAGRRHPRRDSESAALVAADAQSQFSPPPLSLGSIAPLLVSAHVRRDSESAARQDNPGPLRTALDSDSQYPSQLPVRLGQKQYPSQSPW